MARERIGQLQRGVIKLLWDQPEGLPAKEALARLEKLVPPTQTENSEYPNRPGIRRYEKIVRFNSIPLVKAGWLVKSNSRWYATEEGKKAYEKFTDPRTFSLEARRLYKEWAAKQPDVEDDNEEAVDEHLTIGWELAASIALEEAEEKAWEGIKKYCLRNWSPTTFKRSLLGY